MGVIHAESKRAQLKFLKQLVESGVEALYLKKIANQHQPIKFIEI